MKSYVYGGPSGYNPDLGQLTKGKEKELSEEEYEKFKMWFFPKTEPKIKKQKKQTED